MGDKANSTWGSKEGDYPVSEINERKIIPVPVIKSEGSTFKRKTLITLQSTAPGLKLFYMLTGPFERPAVLPYSTPIEIDTTTTIYAFAKNDADEKSLIAKATFYKNPHPDWKIKINSGYAPEYTGGGDEATIDGIRGELTWRKGEWQGYTGKDFEAVIDLGKIQEIKKLGAGFLQDSGPWILFPTKVEFEISTDGKKFTKVITIPNTIPDKDNKAQLKDFTENISPQKAQFVKVHAFNYGKLPSWHPGYEDKGTAWLFVDEIIIE